MEGRLAGVHVHPTATVAPGVELAPGAVLHAHVTVGAGSRIGSHAVLHAGSALAEDCVVEDGAVLGKRPRLREGSSSAGRELEAVVLERGATVCAGAVVYAGVRLGPEVIVGDQAHVRENTSVGERTVVGRGSSIEFSSRVGRRVLIQSGVYVTAHALVEDDVFLAPGVYTTNDNTMARHDRSLALRGPVFRRACRVGGGAVLLPGIEIGEEAFVAAGAVVTRDVAARTLVMGAPARVVREIDESEVLERWR